MKKLCILSALAFILAACAGNKNILNEKMSKYPADKYITKIASAQEKEAAKQAALKDLRTLFDSLPRTQESAPRRESILARAAAVQWWKDKPSGKYFAIAALERAGAQQTMQPFYVPVDGKLAALMLRVNGGQDKFVRVKDAMQMQPLLTQRAALDAEYRLLAFDSSAYDEEKLYAFRSAFNQAFYDIKINCVLTGTDDDAVKTAIIDGLNGMGFAVGEDLPAYDMQLSINTKVTKTSSKTTEGLYWADSTATVSLKDMRTGGIFATFSKFGRDGSGRPEEARRRSMIAVGADSVPVIKHKLLEYIERK
ncbi:MAG: hypothetical protein LBL61_03200 [Elusimicrobiota bacterium]|jgi:hypothetical protein|nr:hypothetical protein [Elusimicrobiota bacterium]